MKTIKPYSKPEATVIHIEAEGVMAESSTFTVSNTDHGGGMSRSKRRNFWEEK